MKLLLHWLRRDFLRHAPFLALWALLVALFTWARVWLRTHPDFFIGDRDLWLSVPAAALGFAEVCLLLHILLDDPARGARAFWKTRPPGGAAVFGAKAVLLALVALVIPLAAEAAFLGIVGPSAGTMERVALYFLPPVLALAAGVAAVSWKSTLLWLPLVIAAFAAASFALVWLVMCGALEQIADLRLMAAGALAAAVLVAALAYRRRTAGRGLVIAALLLPGVAAVGLACTGWPRDPRLSNPPPGLDAAALKVSWLQPVTVSRNNGAKRWFVLLPLRFDGLPPEYHAEATLHEVTLRSGSLSLEKPPLIDQFGAVWSVLLNETDARHLQAHGFTVTGTAKLRLLARRQHRLPLAGTHTVESGDFRWNITPAVDGSRRHQKFYGDPGDEALWYQYDMVPLPAAFSPENTLPWDHSASLRRASDQLPLPLQYFRLASWRLLWEGIGRDQDRFHITTPNEEARAAARELKDPAKRGGWSLEFETFAFAGTVEVPFTLRWPAE